MMTQPDHDDVLPPGSRVAVIAGSGSFPVDVATALDRDGHAPFVVIIDGEADRLAELERFEHVKIVLERGELILRQLQEKGIRHLVMAGGITRRPVLRRVRVSLHVLRYLPRLIRGLAQGDDRLLRYFIGYIESYGISVHAPHRIVPDLLARRGTMTKLSPTSADLKDIAAGFEAARAIGALDIGQGAIAIGGRAVALEGIEGTDGLLARLPELRRHGRLASKKRGVLVKCAKPDQELRADLPAIGVRTVLDARAGGLAGIALQAERALILDMDKTIRTADENGLFIIGLSDTGQP
jgi:DUF1009 family protein